jgi:hypothetical protein
LDSPNPRGSATIRLRLVGGFGAILCSSVWALISKIYDAKFVPSLDGGEVFDDLARIMLDFGRHCVPDASDLVQNWWSSH